MYFLPDDFNCIPVLIGDNSIQFLLSLFVQEKKLRKTRKVHTIVKITYIGRSNLFIVSLSQYHFFLGLRLNFINTGNRTEMYYHFKKGIIFLLLSCLFSIMYNTYSTAVLSKMPLRHQYLIINSAFSFIFPF